MPQPPQLPPLAADHRRLAGVDAGHESPELRLALRKMSCCATRRRSRTSSPAFAIRRLSSKRRTPTSSRLPGCVTASS
jgi:hypothetical protein